MGPEEIEHIKSQIDELNESLAELVEPASPKQRRHERLGQLFLRLEDGELPERSFRRLEKRLQTDRDALDYYVDFMNLSAALHLHYHPERVEHALPFAHHS